MRLLCQYVFVLIDKWTLTQKNGGKKSFSYEIKALMSFIPIERQTLILKMVEIEVSLSKPEHQYYLSQRGECVYGAYSWKEWRLLCESEFMQLKNELEF